MFNTNNTLEHDQDILQMCLVVSDAEAKADNVDFDEALKSDHEGSGPSPLIDPSSPESTSPRNAVRDVLNRHIDPVPFIFGSSFHQSGRNLLVIKINQYPQLC